MVRNECDEAMPTMDEMLNANDIEEEWNRLETLQVSLYVVAVFLELFEVADRYLIGTLAEYCAKGLKGVAQRSLIDAWWAVDKFVRDAEIDCALLRRVLLEVATTKAKEWSEDQKFRDYLIANGEFGADLVQALAK